ncbi:hypothetical protein ACEQPO_26040 [Bacillus sp. SL00103]
MTSMQMASLTAVDQSLSGSASGIFSTFRYFGSIISSTLIGIISGFQSLFIVLMGAGIGFFYPNASNNEIYLPIIWAFRLMTPALYINLERGVFFIFLTVSYNWQRNQH